MEFPYVYFNKPFGFHLPPREVVHRNINQLPSIRKLQVSICDWERLTVFSQQLPQEPWIPENSSRPLTEFLQCNTTLRDEADIKEAKSFHRRKMSDWSSRDHVTLPNSKWRQYLQTLFIPVERRLIAA